MRKCQMANFIITIIMNILNIIKQKRETKCLNIIIKNISRINRVA